MMHHCQGKHSPEAREGMCSRQTMVWTNDRTRSSTPRLEHASQTLRMLSRAMCSYVILYRLFWLWSWGAPGAIKPSGKSMKACLRGTPALMIFRPPALSMNSPIMPRREFMSPMTSPMNSSGVTTSTCRYTINRLFNERKNLGFWSHIDIYHFHL